MRKAFAFPSYNELQNRWKCPFIRNHLPVGNRMHSLFFCTEKNTTAAMGFSLPTACCCPCANSHSFGKLLKYGLAGVRLLLVCSLEMMKNVITLYFYVGCMRCASRFMPTPFILNWKFYLVKFIFSSAQNNHRRVRRVSWSHECSFIHHDNGFATTFAQNFTHNNNGLVALCLSLTLNLQSFKCSATVDLILNHNNTERGGKKEK